MSPRSLSRHAALGLGALGLGALIAVTAAFDSKAFEKRRPETTRQEYVAIALPKGWKRVARSDDGRVQVIEFAPNDQNRTTWTDFVTIQVYHGIAIRPARYLEEQARIMDTACEISKAGQLVEGQEFGRAVAFRTLNCEKLENFASGEFLMFKAIAGQEAFYAVSRSWRVHDESETPTSEELLRWREILRRTQLCLKRGNKNDCAKFNASY